MARFGQAFRIGYIGVLTGGWKPFGFVGGVNYPVHDRPMPRIRTDKWKSAFGQGDNQGIFDAGRNASGMGEDFIHYGYMVLRRTFWAKCQRKFDNPQT